MRITKDEVKPPRVWVDIGNSYACLFKNSADSIEYVPVSRIDEVWRQCAEDICTYCGGRGPTHHREVVGPNEAGNYVHEPTRDYASSGGGLRLCSASPIFSRTALQAARTKEKQGG